MENTKNFLKHIFNTIWLSNVKESVLKRYIQAALRTEQIMFRNTYVCSNIHAMVIRNNGGREFEGEQGGAYGGCEGRKGNGEML